MIDAHIHLDQYDKKFIHEQIDIWQNCGIERVIAVGSHLKSSYDTLELQQSYPNFVSAAVGFHPELPLPTNIELEEWKNLINLERHRITAIGEIGLPHYELERLPHSLDRSIEQLEIYLDEAVKHQLPVALHAVHDKALLTYQSLRKKNIQFAHFHWLKAPLSIVSKIVKSGYYISFTPELCYRKRDQILAQFVPLEQLLIETDGPWQFENEFKNKKTTPLLLNNVVSKLASIKKTSKKELKNISVRNTKRCYLI